MLPGSRVHGTQAIAHHDIDDAAGDRNIMRLEPCLREKAEAGKAQRSHQYTALPRPRRGYEADCCKRQGRKEKEDPLVDTLHDHFDDYAVCGPGSQVRHRLFILEITEL